MLRNIKQINAYPEFQTAADINAVKNAVLNNQVPNILNPQQAVRFTQKFLNNEWNVVNVPLNQITQNHPNPRLVYNPNANISLVVTYPDERNTIMARIYNENRRGLGVGLSAFYNQILLTHLNIQKRYTDNFLRSKGNYQIAKTPVRKVVRPITAKVPNERWMMDLIDMRSQIQQRYILTVVDVFSNYLFATIILNKTGQTIVQRLQNFHNRTLLQGGSQGIYPRLLQSDQGSEFKNDDMEVFANQNNIKQVFSSSYAPKSNGKVERMNRQIRKKIKALHIKNNNNRLTGNQLSDIVKNINSQVNSRTKMRPIDLYENTYNPVFNDNNPVQFDNDNTQDELQQLNREVQNQRKQTLMNSSRIRDYQVGDLVRLNMKYLSEEYRKTYKDKKNINRIAIHFSPMICMIDRVYNPNNRSRLFREYSLRVPFNNGNAIPNLNTPIWTRGNTDIPILVEGQYLVPAGDAVSINPKTINKVNTINSRN